jgi:hypothetical protein
MAHSLKGLTQITDARDTALLLSTVLTKVWTLRLYGEDPEALEREEGSARQMILRLQHLNDEIWPAVMSDDRDPLGILAKLAAAQIIGTIGDGGRARTTLVRPGLRLVESEWGAV